MVHVPLRLTLDGEALVANWRWLAKKSGEAECGAAVKADGYGLGAREVVKRLQAAGCRAFLRRDLGRGQGADALAERSRALGPARRPGARYVRGAQDRRRGRC